MLKQARSFSGKFTENAPIPARIVRAPGLGPIAVDKRIREQIRTPVLVGFGVALMTNTASCVLAAGRNTGHCLN
jgi:hypothetical protein